MILRVQGVQLRCPNRQKIDSKLKSKMECLLASIFDGFSWFLGAMLGPRIEEKSILKGIKKRMKKRWQLERFWGG